MSSFQKVIITTGDHDGIGTEVAAKALSAVGVKKNISFVVVRSPATPRSHLKIIDRTFRRVEMSGLESAVAYHPKNSRELCDVVLDSNPAEWVSDAATLCYSKSAQALVTGPMSKQNWNGQIVGHTEILKSVSRTEDVFMCFLGKFFNTVCITGHIPLNRVSSSLSADLLVRAAQATHQFKLRLGGAKKSKPLALVGLNPHAGENGKIGNEETHFFMKALESIRRLQISIEGPLVPDVAYTSSFQKKYSFYLSPYHDQALIPFKMAHGFDDGVHFSLGLPFIRTSVDHGTAKDIFNKNKAHAGSMKAALLLALRLMKSKEG